MEFKDFYNEKELTALLTSGRVQIIKATYREPQARTKLPIAVERVSVVGDYSKDNTCILLMNYNDLKAGTKMKLTHEIHGYATKNFIEKL